MTTKKAGSLFVALAIIGVVSIGAIFAGTEAVGFLRSIGADTSAIAIALLLGALVIGSAVRRAGWACAAGRLRAERKAEAYTQALGILMSAIPSPAAMNVATNRGLALADIALWGSPGVIRQLGAIEGKGDPESPEYRLVLETVIREMRQDLGQVNLGLKQGQLADLAQGRRTNVPKT